MNGYHWGRVTRGVVVWCVGQDRREIAGESGPEMPATFSNGENAVRLPEGREEAGR